MTTNAWTCGNWGAITDSDSTSLPNPASGSDSGLTWDWSWSLSGSKGSFAGAAEAHSDGFWLCTDRTTGLHTATGWEHKTMSGWTSGGDGHHVAPTDARVTGQGDGTVTCRLHMDANNGASSAGPCAALAYGKIVFSGIESGSVEINLNCTFVEGDTSISGTLSADPSITITSTMGSGTADASGNRRKALRQQIMQNEFSTLKTAWWLSQKFIDLAQRVMALAA